MVLTVPKRPQFTEADGHQLAVDMLREIQEQWLRFDGGLSDEEVTRGDHWKRADSEPLRRYLETVRGYKSPALERGFFAVLVGFIGMSVDGIDAEYFENHGPTIGSG